MKFITVHYNDNNGKKLSLILSLPENVPIDGNGTSCSFETKTNKHSTLELNILLCSANEMIKLTK